MTPTLELNVIGMRASVPLTAVIDTGFDGDLCLPTTIAVRVGLELAGKQPVELADGTVQSRLVFGGSVQFLGETRRVSIFLTDSDEPLIGTRLLGDCLLSIDFLTERVRVTRSRTRRNK